MPEKITTITAPNAQGISTTYEIDLPSTATPNIASLTLRGPIYYQGSLATTPMIQWINNTSDANGNGIKIGGGGAVIVGAGESASAITASAGDESLRLAADSNIYFYSNAQDGTSSMKTMTFDTNGNLAVPGAITSNGTAVSLVGHTHATSIAASAGTSQITLDYGGKYAITAGGTSFIFSMPEGSNSHYTNYLKFNVGATNALTYTQDSDKTLTFMGSGSTMVSAVAGSGTITISSINTASAADNILKGGNTGTVITYAPYTTQQNRLSFDTSTSTPTRTDRLNLNGSLRVTSLYLGDIMLESNDPASGGTTLSLVTTGEKYNWNNKMDPISLNPGDIIYGDSYGAIANLSIGAPKSVLNSNGVSPRWISSYVAFNNSIFNFVPGSLPDPTYQEEYEDAIANHSPLSMTRADVASAFVTGIPAGSGLVNFYYAHDTTNGYKYVAHLDALVLEMEVNNTGIRTTSIVSAINNPMNDLGQMIYGGIDGIPCMLPHGQAGQVLRVVEEGSGTAFMPHWVSLGAAADYGVDNAITSSATNSNVPTTLAVYNALQNLPEPMVFKGTIGDAGASPTITWSQLPAATAANGHTYKVISNHSSAPICKIGDTIVSNGTEWVVIPSGDEPGGTVTSIKIKTSTYITGGSNTAATTTGEWTIGHDTSGVTAGTYGKGADETPGYGQKFKVPTIQVDAYGHVIAAHTYEVTIPASDNTNTTYQFTGGTNKFTVTPSDASAYDVAVTPSIANNITGSGTNGRIAKFNGTNTITDGPAFGTNPAKFLNNKGEWAIPTAGMSNPMTAFGDMIYGALDGTPVRLAAGTAGQYLTLITDQSNPNFLHPHWRSLNVSVETSTSTTPDILLAASTRYAIKVGDSGVIIETPPDSNTASAVDNILDGSNSGTAITYAPYPAATANSSWVSTAANGGKLYLGTQNPSRYDRLNYNGSLHATVLYSRNQEVATNPMTDFGDIIYGGIDGTPLALAAGTEGQILTLKPDTSDPTILFPAWTDLASDRYHTTGTWSGLTYTATAHGNAGALAFTIPTGTTATTVALGNHTHTLSLAQDSGTSTVSLAANTKYKLTAGGSSIIFTTPVDNDNTTYTFDSENLVNAFRVTPSSGTPDVVNIHLSMVVADDILHGSFDSVDCTAKYEPYPAATATSTWVSNNSNGGKFYLGTENPAKTNRLNFNGNLYSTVLYASNIYSGGKKVATNPMTSVGDLMYGDAGAEPMRLGIGTNGQVLYASGSVPTWHTLTASDVGAAPTTHNHGNILSAGTITSTEVTTATGFLVYDSNNKIQRATNANARTIIGAAPTSHSHGNITSDGKVNSTPVQPGIDAPYMLVTDSTGAIQRMGGETDAFLSYDASWGFDWRTLNRSPAGNANQNYIVQRHAKGSIQTEKLAVSVGTTTKATMQYNTTDECVEFVFA